MGLLRSYLAKEASPAKDLVRTLAYLQLPRQVLYHKKHIVIAGAGGDIRRLKEWGVRPDQIIACDKDLRCRMRAKRSGVVLPPYPDIQSDIAKTVDWAYQQYGGSDIGSISVDLCETLIHGLPVLNSVAEVAPEGVPIFYTFKCAQDPGLSMRKNEKQPGHRRLAYIRNNTFLFASVSRWDFYPYQSWSRNNIGSPMCLAVIP
jgi:hypothetical protein